MQQPPFEQWQPRQYYQQHYVQPQPVYIPTAQPTYPRKNTTMKTLSILSFIAFAALLGLGIIVSRGTDSTVLGLIGCTWLLTFAAGFIFLCLI